MSTQKHEAEFTGPAEEPGAATVRPEDGAVAEPPTSPQGPDNGTDDLQAAAAPPDGPEQDHESVEDALSTDATQNVIEDSPLGERFDLMEERLEHMAQRLNVLATQSRRVTDINAELHRELTKKRDDALLDLMRPAFAGLVRLLGNIDASIARLQDNNADTVDLLIAHRITLSNALQDSGLIEMPATQPETAVIFAPDSQEIVDVRATDDSALDQTVAEVVQPGFAFGDRQLFREKVAVYRYTSAQPEEKDQ